MSDKQKPKPGDVVDVHTTCSQGCCVDNIYYGMKVLEAIGELGIWCEYNSHERIFFSFEEVDEVRTA